MNLPSPARLLRVGEGWGEGPPRREHCPVSILVLSPCPLPRCKNARARDQALADPALRREYGERAQARARERYAWDRVTTQYETLFADLLQGGRGYLDPLSAAA